jgi:hydroxyacylglutathione hydrolase
VGNEKANMSIVHQFTFNPFQENTFVIYDETKEGIIIDPGCYTNEEKQQLQSFIADNKISIKYLINTHCHIDHVLGNVFVKEKFGVGLYIHKEDESTLRSVGTYAQVYGFPQFDSSRADNYLKEGDTVSFGNSALEVIFVPGHAPGHICLVNKKDKYIIGGDVLFYGSMSRRALSSVSFDHLSIDEKSFKKGHKYITVLSHPASGCVLEVEEGRSKKSCKSLLNKSLTEDQQKSVTTISMDMWKAFITTSKKMLPNAEIVHDRFHLIKYLNEAIDKVRSIGRTDLPGGDHATLIKSIRVKIFNLDDDFRVYTGHGPATNIGFEKINNPFFGLNA